MSTYIWAAETTPAELEAREARALHNLRVGDYRASAIEFTWDTGARLMIWHDEHGRVALADDDADGFGVRFANLDLARVAGEATLDDIS